MTMKYRCKTEDSVPHLLLLIFVLLVRHELFDIPTPVDECLNHPRQDASLQVLIRKGGEHIALWGHSTFPFMRIA